MRIVKEHEERRNEILNVASDLFISNGYDKTTINDILKIIGIAKGTFYHYFKSKEEVMDAVIMRVVEHDIVVAKEIINTSKANAFDKLMQILTSQSSESSQQKRDMTKQFQYIENTIMKQRALERSIQYVCPILANVIEEGNSSGEFNTLYPLQTIQFLIAGIQTLMDERMIQSDRVSMENQIKSFADIIYKVLQINESSISQKEVQEKLNKVFIN